MSNIQTKLKRGAARASGKNVNSFPHLPATKIECVEISTLRASPHNARTHSKRQINLICKSVEEFGFTNPLLVDENNLILAGHGRLKAAQQLGWSEVPIIRIDNLSETQKRAYVIADNQLALKAGWDFEMLAIELQSLSEISFDIESMGFEHAEYEVLTDKFITAKISPEENIPPYDPSKVITQPGDLWILGRHRLFCGNALDSTAYSTLMRADKARYVFTDPPYNVKIAGNVSGLGRVKHREFVMASGEMSSSEFIAFLSKSIALMVRFSTSGSIHAICMDWRHVDALMSAGRGNYTELKNICVWVKSNGGMGTFYRSRHEFVTIWKSGKSAHINNFELGQWGRSRTNVWEYAGVNSFQKDRADNIAMHPTTKPVMMVADAIKDCSRRGDIVLDPFGGSGTTLIAAEQSGRRARVIELEPGFCDVIVRRWQALSGERAFNETSKIAFDDATKRYATQPT